LPLIDSEPPANDAAASRRTDVPTDHLQVGHNALGAGQIIDQGARLVDTAVQSGDIFKHDGWKRLQPAFENNTLHFIGLLSDGGVHSRYDQLLLCLQGTVTVSTSLGNCFCLRLRAWHMLDSLYRCSSEVWLAAS